MVPRKDPELLSFGTNFSTRITATPVTFNLDAADATQLSTLLTAYQSAYDEMKQARDAGIRSKSLTSTKDSTRKSFLADLRMLYSKVQLDPAVLDADKDLLGITIRKLPVRHPPPNVAPALDVVEVNGRIVTIRVHDAADPHRTRPDGVKGVTVMSYNGPAPAPSDTSAYKFEGNTTKSEFDVVFPESVEPGTVVYITAFWRNSTDLSGPACTPVPATINYGMTMAA